MIPHSKMAMHFMPEFYPLELLRISPTLRGTYMVGVVHGFSPFLSSGRGELQGIFALSIVANIFKHHHSSSAKVTVICDNQGVSSKCNTLTINSLHRHREPNIDLYIIQ
jgi:hypothetical protein